MKSILFTNDDEKNISQLITVYFCYGVVVAFINCIVNFVAPNTPYDTALCMLVYAFFIIRAIRPVAMRLNYNDILFLLVVSLVYFGTGMLYSENQIYLQNQLMPFLLQVLPLYLLGRSIRNYELLMNCLVKASNYVVFIGFAYYLILIFANSELRSDDMAFAYYYLPFSILCVYSLIDKFTPWALLRTTVAIITQVFCGTRGPLICIAIALIAFILIYRENTVTKTLLTIGFVALMLFVVSDKFTEILGDLNRFLQQNGLENRIIEMLLNEEFADSTGRSEIMSNLMEALNKKPLFGYGLMGDRVVTGGTYAHNIFYELLISFGIILGTFLFAAIVLLILRAVLSKRTTYAYRSFAIFMVSLAFVKLFLSSSFIHESAFFLLLGITLNLDQRGKDNDKNNEENDKIFDLQEKIRKEC